VDAGVMNFVAAFVRTKFPTGMGLWVYRPFPVGNFVRTNAATQFITPASA
jgi:hypothetical protein